jgi:putative uncharacterized protein (fragment)
MKTKQRSLRKIVNFIAISFVSVCLFSCEDDVRTDGFSTIDEAEFLPLSQEQKDVLAYLPKNIIIAHRGSEFWAPEESEAAMRWARNMGADYLECDLQMTKDGVILALHDESLLRTTDIEVIYPNRKNDYVSSFTYDELLKLDIGSWFNEANPEQARSSFVGLDILTLDDVLMIAEGYRIKRDANGKRIVNRDAEGKYISTVYEKDPYDNGNRPGAYIETKAPYLFSGVEKALAKCLTEHGWYADNIADLKKIEYKNGIKGEVDIANTPARVILQTFDGMGLVNLRNSFKRLIPILYLMYDINGNVASYTRLINYAIANGATIMGPNIDYITGYPTSLAPWQGDMIRRSGLDIHAWSFNTQEQYIKYTGPWSDPDQKGGAEKNYLDGSFTNLTDLALNYYKNTLEAYKAKGLDYFRSNAHLGIENNIHKNKTLKTAQEVLDELQYAK